MIGYGSLMSHDSRFRFSDIDTTAIPVWVQGWERGWVTSCPIECFNSVGAYPNPEAKLNAALLPVENISPELHEREKNYRFTEVAAQAVNAIQSASLTHQSTQGEYTVRYWICETLKSSLPDSEHPLLQTYIDTCLAGCLETGGLEFAKSFIESTRFWQQFDGAQYWLNDRQQSKYPRAARISSEQIQTIDALLQEFNLLKFRTSAFAL